MSRPRGNRPIEAPADLLFELASEDRLRILALLERGPTRLTEIARKLSATDPEVSRHLSRLSKAGLVAKAPDGAFVLTPLGRSANSVLPAFTVLATRRDYFLSHDLSSLPPEFVRRIGELAEHRYLDHLDAVLGTVEAVTEGATQYVRIMSDRAVRLQHRHASPSSIAVRAILPRSFEREVQALTKQNWPGAQVEVAYLEPVPVTLILNETRGGVLFPGLDGQIDMNRGLAGDSPAFQGWCRDLFDSVWARARKALA